MTQKAWAGRFEGPTDKLVERFTESVSVDRRLWRQEIASSIAHAQMLAEVGLITEQECGQIEEALKEIGQQIESGQLPLGPELEDIHMHIEAALIERLGEAGRKLHTGRSRNDQVATDLRLWVREAIDGLRQRLADLQRALVAAGRRQWDLVLPGYTHLQRAQPVLAGHYFLAYVEKFERDRERLGDCRRRLNVLPLGAAALAGTSLPIDRDSVRRKLGFDGLASNSLDAVSDRDFAAEFLFCLAMTAVHLSGWAEEWIVWNSVEFGFLELPESLCTGSSIMPQKKNPDVLELVRGKTARVVAALQTLLVLCKGLPLAYNRDLQEDKAAVFEASDTVAACVEMATAVVAAARLRPERIAAGLEEGFLDATALMEYLISRGVAMRRAHEVVGRLVGECERRGCRLAELPLEQLQAAAGHVEADVFERLGAANAARALCSFGSAGPARVQEQLDDWERRLAAP